MVTKLSVFFHKRVLRGVGEECLVYSGADALLFLLAFCLSVFTCHGTASQSPIVCFSVRPSSNAHQSDVVDEAEDMELLPPPPPTWLM